MQTMLLLSLNLQMFYDLMPYYARHGIPASAAIYANCRLKKTEAV